MVRHPVQRRYHHRERREPKPQVPLQARRGFANDRGSGNKSDILSISSKTAFNLQRFPAPPPPLPLWASLCPPAGPYLAPSPSPPPPRPGLPWRGVSRGAIRSAHPPWLPGKILLRRSLFIFFIQLFLCLNSLSLAPPVSRKALVDTILLCHFGAG